MNRDRGTRGKPVYERAYSVVPKKFHTDDRHNMYQLESERALSIWDAETNKSEMD